MRFRTLVLAFALACGTTAMVEANQAKRPVIHRTGKKGTVRRARTSKAHKAKPGKTIRAHR
jgi:hypothetical protein